jgi:hypothetical protein
MKLPRSGVPGAQRKPRRQRQPYLREGGPGRGLPWETWLLALCLGIGAFALGFVAWFLLN